MRIKGLGRLLRYGRWIRSRFIPEAVILLYHRVTKLASDPQILCVSPEHFADHLAILRDDYHPISLEDLLRAVQGRNIPRGAVVMTFDDGYRDNLREAKPILSRFNISATVFVACGNMPGQREFWWDEVERLILATPVLPPALHISMKGEPHEIVTGSDDTSQEHSVEHTLWNVESTTGFTGRHQVYRQLVTLLFPLTPGEQSQILQSVCAQVRAEAAVRATHTPMSPSEIRELIAGNLISVGGHTENHARLSSLSEGEQTTEITRNKQQLENICGTAMRTFSYPYGKQEDYTARSAQLVKDAGYACACSAFPGRVGLSTDLYQLPRIPIRDCPGDVFAHILKSAFSHAY